MTPFYNSSSFPGIQTFCGSLGKWSCYAFCILKIAETETGKRLDVLKEILIGIYSGWIWYNWENHDDKENLFVRNAENWLVYLTGERYEVEKVYEKPQSANYVVECWNNAHFRLPDWDSLAYSNSVATGKITSWRVFKQK